MTCQETSSSQQSTTRRRAQLVILMPSCASFNRGSRVGGARHHGAGHAADATAALTLRVRHSKLSLESAASSTSQ